MKKIAISITAAVMPILLIIGVAEIILRIQPSIIGLPILERFHPALGAEVGKRLGLQTGADRPVISSVERHDRGPDIYMYRPNSRYVTARDEVDIEYGSVDYLLTDSLGFCNVPGAAERTNIDILVLSGSIPNCAGVLPEAIFTAQLERLAPLRTYSLGVGNTGPYEYVELLRRFGDRFKPKIVLMSISEANDLRDILRYQDFRPGETGAKRIGGPFRWSYSLAFLKGGIEFMVKAITSNFGPDFRYVAEVGSRRIGLNTQNGDLDELRMAKQLASGQIDASLYELPIRMFVEIAKQRRFRPVIALMPAVYTVYRSSLTFNDPSIAPILHRYHELQRDWLKSHQAELGYRFVDPEPAMSKSAQRSPLYFFPATVHPTIEGHAALAEAVEPQLRQFYAASR